jgi:hypothetical protein
LTCRLLLLLLEGVVMRLPPLLDACLLQCLTALPLGSRRQHTSDRRAWTALLLLLLPSCHTRRGVFEVGQANSAPPAAWRAGLPRCLLLHTCCCCLRVCRCLRLAQHVVLLLLPLHQHL